ncbi:MAG TPA: ROK family transcriptional regulator [Streptosporangiaceae bacterium]|nr:ROK family transcriptional regulator [Streptosporangiaceae bacterium]
MAARTSAQATLLRAVHGQPGVTRAAVAQELGMPSGFAAETVARLVAARLLSEEPAPPTGSRGRPTTLLRAHPDGPLAAVAAITHETWTVAVAELGGAQVAAETGPHDRDQDQVLAAVTAQLDAVAERFGARIRAAAVAVPGTVVGSQLVYAPNLGWHDVDLSGLWPHYHPELPLIAGNDATCAAVAESRHGAGAGAGTMVYLHLAAGIGGALVEGDRVVAGATGAAGEFGHMPFGDPAVRCRCGAMGCWNTTLDGGALSRALGQPVPADEISFIRRLLAAARGREPGAAGAVRGLARSVGRGAAGLVNALDPHLVAVGGLGQELLEVAGAHATAAYHDGLMAFRTLPPPPLVAAHLPDDGSLLGAAELCFDRILTGEGLQAWTLAPAS